MDALLARLRDRIRHSPAVEMDAYCVHSNDAGEILPPRKPNRPLLLNELDSVQSQLGFELPTIVRRLSTEVADGGFGPDWGINRLKHPPHVPYGPFWEVEMSVESWHRFYHEGNNHDWLAPYPERFIRYCECGCNISICVDCTSIAGSLFVDDPNQRDDPLKPMDESIEQWLWRWLNEKPWPETMY